MNGRTRLILVLLAASLVAVVGCTPTHSALPTDAAAPPSDRFFAPDFALPDLDGQMVRLSALRGQIVVINFWATYCPPCIAEMPDLQAIAADYASRVVVLGINQREDSEQVRAFVAERGVDYPILLQPDDATLIAYQVLGLPQTSIIDPLGEIVFRAFGPIDADEVRAIINDLL